MNNTNFSLNALTLEDHFVKFLFSLFAFTVIAMILCVSSTWLLLLGYKNISETILFLIPISFIAFIILFTVTSSINLTYKALKHLIIYKRKQVI